IHDDRTGIVAIKKIVDTRIATYPPGAVAPHITRMYAGHEVGRRRFGIAVVHRYAAQIATVDARAESLFRQPVQTQIKRLFRNAGDTVSRVQMLVGSLRIQAARGCAIVTVTSVHPAIGNLAAQRLVQISTPTQLETGPA